MTPETVERIITDIDDRFITEAWEYKPRRRSAPALAHWAAAAAAVILVMLIPFGTAQASGVSIVKPFVRWAESGIRLDYSAGLDRHEDAPEITANPSEKPTVSIIPSEYIIFASEEDLKARVGNMIRLPGEELGLEFVEAKGAFSDNTAIITSNYTIDGKTIMIDSSLHAGIIGTDHSAKTLILKDVSRYEQKEIAGIECTLAYGAPWNYVSIIIENQSYLVFGEAEMNVLEMIAASMLASK